MEINLKVQLMYETVIDQSDSEEWNRLCSGFTGMSIYQTGLYGELHSAGILRSCSRIAIFKESQVVAAAQLRIKLVPVLSIGVAEIDWGPLWCSSNGKMDRLGLGVLLDEIRREYCEKRKLQIRVRPRSTVSQNTDLELHELLMQHGYCKNQETRPYHTVLIDLQKSIDTIRSEFHQKWRNQLNVAERSGLEYECGNNIEYFDRFYAIYKAMWEKKKFPTGVRLPIIRELQEKLAPQEKFIVTILHNGQVDIGATVCTVLGDTMLYFLGATTPELRNDSRPGYLLQWLHIQKAKELGVRWYDLGGYDDINPDLARFKKRTNGIHVLYPGQYETGPLNFSSKFLKICEKGFRKTKYYVTSR
ncbi:GNAT family N-acetyltransferase [Candidatus Roizmanbacteria bacterium]|nr:GNAT family N-acetyltransferase [Candidatus Roizmanbacteria bacterium]